MDKEMLARLRQEIAAQEKTVGLSMTDILALPDPLQELIKWLVRNSESKLADIAAYIDRDADIAKIILTELIDKGFVRAVETRGEPRYRICLSTRRKREYAEILEMLG